LNIRQKGCVELKILGIWIDQYEIKIFSIDSPDPIEAINSEGNIKAIFKLTLQKFLT